MSFPISIHLSIFASLAVLSMAAHSEDPRANDAVASCPDKSKSPVELCVDPACAERAKKQMDAQLECHKKRMKDLEASAGGIK